MDLITFSIDAGHAGFGVTPGKRTPDGSMYEWEFNSAVVRYIMLELANYENVAVIRCDDPSGKQDISLKKRSERANTCGSCLHISVHANAAGSGWGTAEGIETFVYKKSGIAYSVASLVQKKLIAATGLRDRGVKEDDLHMVRETKCPAILVEAGFMTNKEEAALLKSEDYRKKVAYAISSALVEYYNLKLRKQTVLWDGVELKKGQIGRITILKPINLWNRFEDGIEMARILQPGEVYRVYEYDNEYGGQYNVGGLYITNMEGYIKYETPSKTLLERVNG